MIQVMLITSKRQRNLLEGKGIFGTIQKWGDGAFFRFGPEGQK